MRLLQISLRSLLLYSMLLVLVSIPVSLFLTQAILDHEIDETLSAQTEDFLKHIRGLEYLDDLETDLRVLDELTYNIEVSPTDQEYSKPEFRTVLMYDSLEQDEHPFRQLSTFAVIKGKPYMLTMMMSLVDGEDLLVAIGTVQIALLVFLAFGLLLLNRSLSRRLWRPFYETLSQLKAYELDKNEFIQGVSTDIIEFDDLNKAVSHLTERNRRIFLEQKEFIENASHELQTPLAVFQSKLDNLMQSPSLVESDADTIQELEETAQRMARLNKNLLLLSKIDNEQFADLTEVNVAELLQAVLSNVKLVTEPQNLTIEMDIRTCVLRSNKTLIEILLTNLLHNAVRHTERDGRVAVSLIDNVFKITNTGLPLTMSSEKMFKRFSSESLNDNSTGIGLAIVKKICDVCRYQIRYEFKSNEHCFTVAFGKAV